MSDLKKKHEKQFKDILAKHKGMKAYMRSRGIKSKDEKARVDADTSNSEASLPEEYDEEIEEEEEEGEAAEDEAAEEDDESVDPDPAGHPNFVGPIFITKEIFAPAIAEQFVTHEQFKQVAKHILSLVTQADLDKALAAVYNNVSTSVADTVHEVFNKSDIENIAAEHVEKILETDLTEAMNKSLQTKYSENLDDLVKDAIQAHMYEVDDYLNGYVTDAVDEQLRGTQAQIKSLNDLLAHYKECLELQQWTVRDQGQFIKALQVSNKDKERRLKKLEKMFDRMI